MCKNNTKWLKQHERSITQLRDGRNTNINKGKRALIRWDHSQTQIAPKARSKRNFDRGKSVNGSYPNKDRQKTNKTPWTWVIRTEKVKGQKSRQNLNGKEIKTVEIFSGEKILHCLTTPYLFTFPHKEQRDQPYEEGAKETTVNEMRRLNRDGGENLTSHLHLQLTKGLL